jgi:ankyrin repeat protein
MKKYMSIIKDGLTLILVSTVFVTVVNQGFKGLKKSSESDPLVTAVSQGHVEALGEVLSEKGFEAEKGSFADLNSYLKARANRRDEFGRTPLMRAALVNLTENDEVLKADKSREPFIDYLTEHGADVNAVDNDAWSALMWASWSGMPAVTAKLIAKGADVLLADRQGHTALMIAAMRGQVEVVKILTEKGADIAARNRQGKTAEDLARDSKSQYRDLVPNYDKILELLKGTSSEHALQSQR